MNALFSSIIASFHCAHSYISVHVRTLIPLTSDIFTQIPHLLLLLRIFIYWILCNQTHLFFFHEILCSVHVSVFFKVVSTNQDFRGKFIPWESEFSSLEKILGIDTSSSFSFLFSFFFSWWWRGHIFPESSFC